MRKNIGKIIAYASIGTMFIGSYFFGTTQAKTEKIPYIPDGYIDTKSDEFLENYVDMRKVVCWEANDGLQLYYDDGSGYYYAIGELDY